MTDETVAARPPAGWLLDATTGQTRWWDGVQWTEHAKPSEHGEQKPPLTRAALRAAAQARPVPTRADSSDRLTVPCGAAVEDRTQPRPPIRETETPLPQRAAPVSSAYIQPARYAPSAAYNASSATPFTYARQPLTSKNGPAKASLILILLLVLGVGAVVWFISGQDPALVMLLGFVNIAMVLAAFVLAIVGLVIAVRRPTKKRESIFALVVSSLMLIFLVVRLVLAVSVSALDAGVLESQIAAWVGQQTSETFQVRCPAEPSAVPGTVFNCSATGDAGTAWTVQVTVNADDTVGWEVVG